MTEHIDSPDETGAESPILVDATTTVGSARLAAALAASDVPGIGQALRHDYVVLPIFRTASGDAQIGVLPAEGGTKPYELCLYSSTATFAPAAEGSGRGDFELRRGTELIPFLTEYLDVLERVVFDPAGPHPMMATPHDVLWSLQPRPGDDEVAWAAQVGGATGSDLLEPFAPGADPKAAKVVALDIALSPAWAVLDLTNARRRKKQITDLTKHQLKRLGEAPTLRRELATWLETTAARASASGGVFQAFLLQRNDKAALALSMVMYWHELGPAIGDTSHLERVTGQLRGDLADGDQLAGSETAAGPFVRHTQERAGSTEVGGQDTPLLITDYWLAFPDERGLCLLSFTSPHVTIREELLLLTDNIVLTGAWVLESPATG